MGDRVIGTKGLKQRVPARFFHHDEKRRDEEIPSYHPITL
jgi:hypothetical protein